MDPDVVVVGAGPTGLALACGLRAAGVAVRVLDRRGGPAADIAGPGPAATRRRGPRPARCARRSPRPRAAGSQRVINVDGRELARLPIGRSMRGSTGVPRLLMSQADIEQALRNRLTALGGSVEWGQRRHWAGRRSGRRQVSSVTAEVRAGWVVGADGAHSVVRKAMGIDFPGVPLIEHFLLADVHADLDRHAGRTYGGCAGHRCSPPSRCPASTSGA